VRSFTNLSWPDGPYGSEFRPFGKREHLLTAVAVDWTYTPETVPVSVSVVYLRVRPATKLDVDERSLTIGFHTTAIEAGHETQVQLAHLDKVLIGARRHATILASHRFQDDLTQALKLTDHRLPGVQGVSEAWTDRQAKGRGIAHMVDTCLDVPDSERPELHVSLDPLLIVDDGQMGYDLAAVIAVRSLARCLAIGLTAAVHTGRFRWTGTFSAQSAVAENAWDVFDMAACPTPTH